MHKPMILLIFHSKIQHIVMKMEQIQIVFYTNGFLPEGFDLLPLVQ